MSEHSPATNPSPAAGGTRTVLAKGERVPWPRRLIAMGLLAAVLALALHALPRPYQTLPTGVVRGLGDGYGSLRHSYKNEVAALEPVAGEVSAAERKAYARELWRHRWLGSFREILLRFSEWLAATCMFVALSLIFVERRRTRRAMTARGAVTAPTVLRHETLAGDPLAPAPPPPPVFSPDATPPFPLESAAGRSVPLRETGDEVTPPHPTPIPSQAPGALELRPSPFDDDDLDRATESQTPNLAKRPVATSTPTNPAPPSTSLPVFFTELRHPEAHPVVHPGENAPSEEGVPPLATVATAPTPMPVDEPTPTPVSSEVTASAEVTVPSPEVTPTPVSSEPPSWLNKKDEDGGSSSNGS
jgi:hypothetical protein